MDRCCNSCLMCVPLVFEMLLSYNVVLIIIMTIKFIQGMYNTTVLKCNTRTKFLNLIRN